MKLVFVVSYTEGPDFLDLAVGGCNLNATAVPRN